MNGYLLLVLAAVLLGTGIGGLIILAGSCSEEARARKLDAGRAAFPPDRGMAATTPAGVDYIAAYASHQTPLLEAEQS